MKELYQQMNKTVIPPADLKQKVFSKLERKTQRRYFRPLTAAAMLLAMVILFNPVVTAHAMPVISDLMYQVSPEIAARFTPIQQADERNGIRMEVISASIHGATSEICVSFKDLQGHRLDEGIVLINSDFRAYGSERVKYGGTGGGVDMMEFDPDTETLTIMEHLKHHFYSEEEGRYLSVRENYGEKITYVVNYLIKNTALPQVELPVVLSQPEITVVEVDENKQIKHPFDSFGSRGSREWLEKKTYQVMAPGDAAAEISEEVQLMGMAYIDGQLHVQLRTRTLDEEREPGCEIYLLDAQGKEFYSEAANSFSIKRGSDRGEYREWIFNIPESELENYTLMCNLGQLEYIKGPWRVTFPVTESDYEGEGDDGIPRVTVSATEIGAKAE